MIDAGSLSKKHQKTLTAIFEKPTRVNIRFSDIEALIVALHGEVIEGAGSRIACHIEGVTLFLHRPHPSHEAYRWHVEKVRKFFENLGIKP